MSLRKKFTSVALAATTFVWLSGATMIIPVANAATTQETIDSLMATITALTAKINALQGGGVVLAGAPSGFTFTSDLTVGSKGADVKVLQQFLNSNGYQVAVSGPGSVGNESTYFGALTKAALAKYQAANSITPSVGYFGPKTRAWISSVVVAPVTPVTTLPAGCTSAAGFSPTTGQPCVATTIPTTPAAGLAISLASDNPAASTLPQGATGVAFLKFNVSGSGTLSSLTFKRVGVGATGDFATSGFYLFDGSTRLTSGRSLNSTTHEVSFVNLALTISGTKTLTLVADVDTTVTAGNVNGFELVGMTGDPTPTGTVKGSFMTMSGQSVGDITADDQAAPANPKIGQKEAPMLELKLTAGSTEDILIQRISLTEGGTVTNANLSNFILKDPAGATVATAVSIGAKDLLTLNFTTPYLLEKGQNRIFTLYGDISGSTRSDDTIVFYIDSKADVYATGKVYGYPTTPTITDIDTTSESDTLTIQGGDITITFNGPIKGDIALRGQDVTVFDFTIASLNQVEIKNLRFNATTTGLISGEGFNDFKLWDATSNSVISSATDVTTSSAVTVTDVVNLNAGQSKRMKVTVDVDADNDDGDDILVSLLAFQSGDIKNLDNNTNVATSTIVPSAQIIGNVQDTAAPALTISLAGSPGSQSATKGATNLNTIGFSFRASNDDIKITSVKISASTSNATGTISTLTADVLNLALYDGETKVSDLKSLTGSALPATATFSSMNYVITKGQTKTLTVRANLSSGATVDAGYFVYLAALTDVTAVDSQSNTVAPTGATANSGATVAMTVLNSGDITIVKATDDNDSKPSIVLAGQEVTLAKFKVTAANEAMTINKMRISVIDSSSGTATSTGATDEVAVIKLYDGATQIGASGGYSVDGSGNSAGVAIIEDLGWAIGKNEEKTLTVKAPINVIDISSANGADSGTSLYANVQAAGFEAAGSTALDTTITTALGNQKVVYRGRPTVTTLAVPSAVFGTNPVVAKFRIAAGVTAIAFKSFSLKVEPTFATMTAAVTSTITVNKLTVNPSLTLATSVSGSTTASTGAAAIVGGATGYVTVYFATAEEIGANSYADYEVSLTFNNISGTVGAAKLSTKLNVAEAAIPTVGTFASIGGGTDDGNPSFIWSDFSKISHAETTADWTSGYLAELPVSTPWLLSN